MAVLKFVLRKSLPQQISFGDIHIWQIRQQHKAECCSIRADERTSLIFECPNLSQEENVSPLNSSTVVFEVLILIPAVSRSASVWGSDPLTRLSRWVDLDVFSVLPPPLMIWAQGLISAFRPLTPSPQTVISAFLFSSPQLPLLLLRSLCIFILQAPSLSGFLFTAFLCSVIYLFSHPF